MTPAPPATARRGPRQPVLWLFVGVVTLAVVGSVVGFVAARAAAGTPVDAARGYLQALADADAGRALSFTSAPPVDRTLLTDAVLADSRRRAPLTDVQVTAAPGADDAVDVRYRLGDQPVADHYTLSRVAGTWELDRVSVPVDFLPDFDSRLPVLVNGTEVRDQGSEAFPVSYAVTTGREDVDWGPTSTTTVDLAAGLSNLDLDVRLTPAGRKAFVAGAKKAVAACTSQRQLAPDGCPFGFRQPTRGPRIPSSTVRWKVKGDPWSRLTDPEVDVVTEPGTARASVAMTFTCLCRFSTGQACRPQDVTNPVVFAADVTREPLEVRLAS